MNLQDKLDELFKDAISKSQTKDLIRQIFDYMEMKHPDEFWSVITPYR